jgi:nucleoside-diphosphate-sugar epimerase
MEILGSKLFNNFISLRLFQVYGPQDFSFRVVPASIAGKSIELKYPYYVTDMIFHKDLNNLVYKLIKSNNVKRGIFNAGNGKPISILNLVKKIRKLKRNNLRIKLHKNASNEKNYSYAYTKDLNKHLKWQPDYDIISGLKELINERKI